MSRGDGTAGSRILFAAEGDASSGFGKKRAQSAEMISSILNTVPKTYHGKARSLLNHLLAFPPSRISWDRRGDDKRRRCIGIEYHGTHKRRGSREKNDESNRKSSVCTITARDRHAFRPHRKSLFSY